MLVTVDDAINIASDKKSETLLLRRSRPHPLPGLVFRRVRAEVIFGRGTGVETFAFLQLLKVVQAERNALADVVERERRNRRARVATGVEFFGAD